LPGRIGPRCDHDGPHRIMVASRADTFSFGVLMFTVFWCVDLDFLVCCNLNSHPIIGPRPSHGRFMVRTRIAVSTASECRLQSAQNLKRPGQPAPCGVLTRVPVESESCSRPAGGPAAGPTLASGPPGPGHRLELERLPSERGLPVTRTLGGKAGRGIGAIRGSRRRRRPGHHDGPSSMTPSRRAHWHPSHDLMTMMSASESGSVPAATVTLVMIITMMVV
jgi:hypothetical protein